MKARFLPAAALAATALSAVTTQAQLQLQPLWSVAPGVRPYLTTGNTERGMTYDPVTGNVLVLSRAGGLSINVLDGTTGADKGTLNLGDINANGVGTFKLNMIGASAGGIFAGNLTTDGSATAFQLYRWANLGSAPTLVFNGNPNAATKDRWGDTIAVRGEGAATQVLLGSRNGTSAAVLMSGDGGATYSPGVINTDAAAGDFGLGVAFGAGNSFWGTASGRTLRHIEVDPNTLAGTTAGNFGADVGVPLAVSVVGVEPNYGVLAGIELVAGPDVLRFYEIKNGYPLLLDTETMPVDNANANGTGSIAFGGGKLFVMDSNHGIQAFDIIPEPREYLLLGLGLAAILGWQRRQKK